jgi:hypothetical protein
MSYASDKHSEQQHALGLLSMCKANRKTFEGCGVLGFNFLQFGESPNFRSNLPSPSESLLLGLLFSEISGSFRTARRYNTEHRIGNKERIIKKE